MNRGGRYQQCSRGLLLAIVAMTIHAAAQDTKYVPDGVWEELMISAPPCLMPKDPWVGNHEAQTMSMHTHLARAHSA
jgi:hypothetical protein